MSTEPQLVEAELHDVVIQLVPAGDGDPGVLETGHYVVYGDKVALCDAEGHILGKWEKTLGTDPKKVAAHLLHSRDDGSRWRSRFNRRIHYPKTGIA